MNTLNSSVVKVCQTGKSHMVSDVGDDPNHYTLNGLVDTCSELALPLQIGEEMIGVLDIHSDQRNAFNLEDKTVLQTLANQIAIAIRNARLYGLEKDLRRIEEERAHALAELNASKDKFFSIVSHDLRGPFTGLLGGTQFMLASLGVLTKQDIEEMTQHFYDSAKAAYDLLENLLAWSRIQRGRMEYHPGEVEVNAVVRNTIHLFRENAVRKKIQLINATAVSTMVYADKNMFDTVIRNLVSNAIKFTPPGGRVIISAHKNDPTAETSRASQTTQSEFVQISVSDTGVGINQENIDKLFRIDVHLTTLGTDQESGTGLGLIMCKEMVEKNGGRIWIESEAGKGTTVNFTVPTGEISFELDN
jgi:signal transduction histidine kinase